MSPPRGRSATQARTVLGALLCALVKRTTTMNSATAWNGGGGSLGAQRIWNVRTSWHPPVVRCTPGPHTMRRMRRRNCVKCLAKSVRAPPCENCVTLSHPRYPPGGWGGVVGGMVADMRKHWQIYPVASAAAATEVHDVDDRQRYATEFINSGRNTSPCNMAYICVCQTCVEL